MSIIHCIANYFNSMPTMAQNFLISRVTVDLCPREHGRNAAKPLFRGSCKCAERAAKVSAAMGRSGTLALAAACAHRQVAGCLHACTSLRLNPAQSQPTCVLPSNETDSILIGGV